MVLVVVIVTVLSQQQLKGRGVLLGAALQTRTAGVVKSHTRLGLSLAS